jgi:hypothetical protein
VSGGPKRFGNFYSSPNRRRPAFVDGCNARCFQCSIGSFFTERVSTVDKLVFQCDEGACFVPKHMGCKIIGEQEAREMGYRDTGRLVCLVFRTEAGKMYIPVIPEDDYIDLVKKMYEGINKE